MTPSPVIVLEGCEKEEWVRKETSASLLLFSDARNYGFDRHDPYSFSGMSFTK